jgi:hypothetical protein
VDTLSDAGYGHWAAGARRCLPLAEGAAGIYDDGATHIWLKGNTVWDSDQGINLDVETPSKTTSYLLVSGNVVRDSPGTSQADPSYGPAPPGAGGRSTVAGHDIYAMYIVAFGPGSAISDVYVHDNVFQNQSQHYLAPLEGMPVIDIAGKWSGIDISGITRSKAWAPRTSTTPCWRSTSSRSRAGRRDRLQRLRRPVDVSDYGQRQFRPSVRQFPYPRQLAGRQRPWVGP